MQELRAEGNGALRQSTTGASLNDSQSRDLGGQPRPARENRASTRSLTLDPIGLPSRSSDAS